MKKLTVKEFEILIQKYHFNSQFTQEEKDELYQLYSQLYSINKNIVLCLNGIRQLLFVSEQVDSDNVDYFKLFNIDYSSNIFSNELLRHYSFSVLLHVLTIGMRDVSSERILFFENRNPKLWTKKLNFYKSKLKKVCIENSYVYMTEMLDKLYRVLVKLHYDLETNDMDDTFIWMSLLTDNYPLYEKVYGDKDGNFDESFILSDYYFKSTTADEIISNYESKLKHDCNVPQLLSSRAITSGGNAKKDDFGRLATGLPHDESGRKNYKVPPLNPLKGTSRYNRLLKYLYPDWTLHENCSEIESRRTNLKSPSGDLGVDN